MAILFPTFIHRFDRLDSTMTEASRLIQEEKSAHGHVIITQEQTHGRGRLGRRWESLPNNVMTSLILELHCSPFKAAEVSFVSALAIGETVKSFVPNETQVCYKWPNDVLVNQSKIAGVLLEICNSPRSDSLFLTIGIGLNVHSFPKETLIQATCLKDFTKSDISLEDVYQRLWSRFETYFHLWQQEGFDPIRQRWLENAASRGQLITVVTGDKTLTGIFVDLDSHGRLALETSTGDRTTILAGDVFFPQLRMTKQNT